jgi:hypothetical protein
LKLYVAGQTAKSLQAFANLKRICEEHLANGRYEIEVIDLLKSPQLAKGDQILALPTLVRKLPEPVGRLLATCRIQAGAGGAGPAATNVKGGRMKRPKTHDATKAFEDALAAQPDARHYRLRLFVSGTTPKSARAIQNIRDLRREAARPLRARSDRYLPASGAGQAGTDCGYPDARQEAAAAVPQDHRGSLRQGGCWRG